MLAYPQPPLAPFQVTLLPEQQQQQASSSTPAAAASTSSSSSVLRALEASKAANWAEATAMLHGILELAGEYRQPQVKFASYSPETVMRSVRGIVDDDRCAELLKFLQEAVRKYAQQCVEKIAELRRQSQASPTAISTLTQSKPAALAKDINEEREEESDDDDEDGEGAGDAASRLDAVWTLAIFVTYFERLQHGVAELASVWVYANQWCTLHASREIPRSLAAAATEEASAVFRGAPELFEVAMKGYCAVLKAELAADTLALDMPTPTASTATITSGVAQLKSPATAADAKMDVSKLDMLARPPSMEQLTTSLRRRLLFLFTQLTRDSQQYNTLVEPVVVRIVRRHFARVARRWWAEELSARKYFELSETALKHAETVHQQYLHSGTIPLIEDAIQSMLIGSVGAEVLRRDFTVLMELEQFHALRLAWRLLSSSAHVRSAPAVVALFRAYLLECGQRIMEELVPGSAKATPAGGRVAARERPFLAVRHLIGLLEQGGRAVERCFHECEKEFKVALHEALQTILEAYPNAFSEQLAAYQDAIMKEVEAGHVPVSVSAAQKDQEASSGLLQASAQLRNEEQPGQISGDRGRAAQEEEGNNEGGEEDRSPLRRPRAESVPHSAAVAHTGARGGQPRDEGERAGEEREAVLGAAALRHAAPLPAEAKEATPVLRRIAFLYSYHPKKDLFETAYWRDFARRCLHPHRKVDVAAESAFILYLRDICGLSFTSKFEGMLTDLESSSQLTAEYKTWRQEKRVEPEEDAVTAPTAGTVDRTAGLPFERGAVETHLLILAHSFWPKYGPQPPRLYVPPALQRITQEVQEFYTGRFPNRHLIWQHPLANATLRAQLTPQSPTLTLIGTYVQCMALMRLDALLDKGVATITVKALCDEVGVDCSNVEVLWSLQGLCHPRCRLAVCDGSASATAKSADTRNEEGEEETGDASKASLTSAQGVLGPSDVVRLNLAFTSSTAKVRIPLQTRSRAAVAAGADGNGRGVRTADSGARLVEVAIVSCMKARRTLSHADLVSEVNTRVPFPVSVPVLKKAIEKMIERGFIVRGKDNVYSFSA